MPRTTGIEVPSGPVSVIRFRNIHTAIGTDAKGDYVDMTVPAREIPKELGDGLEQIGLSESQIEEVLGSVRDMTTMNMLMDKREGR